MNKAELRLKYLTHLTDDVVRDQKIIDNLSSFMNKYKNILLIGIYFPMDNEIDISSIIMKFPKVKFALPKILSNKMIFVNYHLGMNLEPNNIFIKCQEPSSSTEVYPKLIFIPGVAFGLDGYRLGRGMGYYDRYLAEHSTIKIGVCPSHNMVMSLPNEIYDRKMDYIVTEDMILDLCS